MRRRKVSVALLRSALLVVLLAAMPGALGCGGQVQNEGAVRAWLSRMPPDFWSSLVPETVLPWEEWCEVGRRIPRCEERLWSMFDAQPSRDQRIGIVRALGAVGSAKSVCRLNRLLTNPTEDVWVLSEAVWALGEIQGEAAMDALERALRHPVWELRANACLAISRNGSERAKNLLRQAAATDPDERVRAYAHNVIKSLSKS